MFERMSWARRRSWLIVVGLLAAICILVVLPPFVGEAARQTIRAGFAPLCHQLPERSFIINGVPLAVGHRCLGIYLGLTAGAVVMPLLWTRRSELRRHSPLILLVLLAVLGLDWVGPLLGGWFNSVGSRLMTGIVFGAGAGYFAADGLTELLGRMLDRWTASGIRRVVR